MSKTRVIVGGANQSAFSRKQIEDAGADARHLMENSAIIRSLVSVDIITRQLFLLIKAGLDHEVQDGWEVENPQLVIQTLGMSAQEKAIREPVTAEALREALLLTVLPVIDIFCMSEEQKNGKSNSPSPSPAPVHGCDTGTAE